MREQGRVVLVAEGCQVTGAADKSNYLIVVGTLSFEVSCLSWTSGSKTPGRDC